jgi:large conductance mechanosensitive channel
MLGGFKQFVLRGNVVDLAVGVVIGAAFGSVVNAFVKDLMTPLIGIVGGESNFAGWHFVVRGSSFMIGDFLNTAISFVISAAVIYYLVVLPMNKLRSLVNTEKPIEPNTKKCPYCLSVIPVDARKCAFCTSEVVGKKR